MYCDDDDFGRIFVPATKRKELVTVAHEQLLHLGFRIVHSHLARWYWWPHMRRDIEAQLKSCAACQLAKQKRRLAHKQFRSAPLSTPRTQWAFDLKGVHAAGNGHDEIGLAVDLSSHRLVLFSCKGREAKTLCPLIRDRIIYTYGVPLRWRTDHAQELVGRVMTGMFKMYDVAVSTTASYHPQGNASAERAMRYVNVCLTMLSDKQYARWPEYLAAFECAWNSHIVSSIGCTPFEADHGAPMLTPVAAMAAAGAGLDDASDVDPRQVVQKTRDSAKAYAQYAAANEAYHQQQRLKRLNASGTARTFAVGDLVCVFVPPTAAEATRRSRKVKHLAWFRGPCEVMSTDGSIFQVKRLSTGKIYKRTLQNIAPWHAGSASSSEFLTGEESSGPPPAVPSSPTRAAFPACTDSLSTGDVLAAKDEPCTDKYWICVVTDIHDDAVTVRLYST